MRPAVNLKPARRIDLVDRQAVFGGACDGAVEPTHELERARPFASSTHGVAHLLVRGDGKRRLGWRVAFGVPAAGGLEPHCRRHTAWPSAWPIAGCDFYPPGSFQRRGAIVEFEVADVDAERKRIDGLVQQWLQQPKDMPWGNRSMLFCDPDANPSTYSV